MKKQTVTFFIILLFSLLFLAIKSHSQTNIHDSLICLEIKGKITNLGSKSDDTYKVELIYYNTVAIAEKLNVT